jgi:hypothetical protein
VLERGDEARHPNEITDGCGHGTNVEQGHIGPLSCSTIVATEMLPS